MAECWRPVPEWEGLYEVSSHGRVRSLPRTFTYRTGTTITRPGRTLTPIPVGAKGHLRVALSGEGVWRKYLVHRLVLLAFVGEPRRGQEALHGNDIPTDNRLENLRWGTRAENMADAYRNGLMKHWRKDRCKWGHKMTDENTYRRAGRWICRECKRANERKRAKHG